MLMLPSVRLSNPGQPHGSILYNVQTVLSTANAAAACVTFVNFYRFLLIYVELDVYFTLSLTFIFKVTSSR